MAKNRINKIKVDGKDYTVRSNNTDKDRLRYDVEIEGPQGRKTEVTILAMGSIAVG